MGWNDRLADPNSYGDLYPHLRAPRYSEAFLERAEPADQPDQCANRCIESGWDSHTVNCPIGAAEAAAEERENPGRFATETEAEREYADAVGAEHPERPYITTPRDGSFPNPHYNGPPVEEPEP